MGLLHQFGQLVGMLAAPSCGPWIAGGPSWACPAFDLGIAAIYLAGGDRRAFGHRLPCVG